MISILDIIKKKLDKVEVLGDVYDLLGLFGISTTAWQDGEPIPAVLAKVVEWLVDDLWNPFVWPALCAMFLAYASGPWLSAIAQTLYNTPRLLAEPATGPIDIENHLTVAGGAYVGAIAVGQVRVKSSVTGATYTNTTASTIAAWSGTGPYPTATPTMTFEADIAGSASNAQPGDIGAGLVTGPTGCYAIPNAGPLLGSDDETDALLRARAKLVTAIASPGGPRASYQYAATDPVGALSKHGLTPPSSWGTAAPATTRVRVVDPSNVPGLQVATFYPAGAVVGAGGYVFLCTQGGTSGTFPLSGIGGGLGTEGTEVWRGLGNVAVFLASDSGPAAGDNVTPGTDVFKANIAIQLLCVPPGVTCTVLPATSATVTIGTVTLYVSAQSNEQAADAVTAGNAALNDFFATLPIGGARTTAGGTGYVYAKKIEGLLAAPDYIEEISTTFVDTPLGPGAVPIPSYTLQANIVDQN